MAPDPVPQSPLSSLDNGLADALNVPLITTLTLPFVTVLCSTLENRSESADTRMFAARRLGESGRSEALGPLCEALIQDPSAGVRAACALALGNLGKPSAIPVLLQGLRDREPYWRRKGDGSEESVSVAQYAAEALCRFTGELPSHRAEILGELGFAPKPAQSWLYLALSHSGALPKDFLRRMRADAIHTKISEERARLVEALEQAQGAEAKKFFIGIIRGWLSSASAREQACECLGYFKGADVRKEILPVLVEYARKGSEKGASMSKWDPWYIAPGSGAVSALARLGGSEALESLAGLLGGANANLDQQIQRSLVKLEAEGLPADKAIFSALDSTPIPSNRAQSLIETLGILQTELAVAKLIGILQGSFAGAADRPTLWAVTEAIGKHSSRLTRSNFDAVRELSHAQDENRRVAAINIIARLPKFGKYAFRDLTANLRRDVPQRAVEAACSAISVLKLTGAVPILKEVVEDNTRAPAVTHAAAKAIAQLKEPESPSEDDE